MYDEKTHMGSSTMMNEVLVLDPKDCPDMIYFIPCPKSPHGCDTDPTGEYIVGSGKLAAIIPVFLLPKFKRP
jgi:nitrous-oxide reductase